MEEHVVNRYAVFRDTDARPDGARFAEPFSVVARHDEQCIFEVTSLIEDGNEAAQLGFHLPDRSVV